MIPVTQDEFYPGGNCLEACVASILEVPLDALRDYYRHRWAYAEAIKSESRAAYRHLEAKQREERRLGFTLVRVTPPSDLDGAGAEDSPIAFRPIGAVPLGYTIASGPGPRLKPDGRPIYHSVIALDGEVVHDPHPSGAGLVAVEFFELVVPIVPAGSAPT